MAQTERLVIPIENAGNKPRHFVFALLDRFTLMAFTSVVEGLRIANRMADKQIYTWTLVGEGGGTVTSSSGVEFKLDSDLEDLPRDSTILVCGGVEVQKSTTKRLLSWLLEAGYRGVFDLELIGWPLLALSAGIFAFFRDPERVVPQDENAIVAPADGLISLITVVEPPAELVGDDGAGQAGLPPGPVTRISIFMSVFDVHINRTPIAGTIKRIAYIPGKFVNADLDKASDENERAAIAIETEDGKTFVAVQIAGLVARRIVSDAVEGQSYETGERYGIIRFGSRVDVYLEPGMSPLVSVGQTAIAGETVLADTDSSEGRREALVR